MNGTTFNLSIVSSYYINSKNMSIVKTGAPGMIVRAAAVYSTTDILGHVAISTSRLLSSADRYRAH